MTVICPKCHKFKNAGEPCRFCGCTDDGTNVINKQLETIKQEPVQVKKTTKKVSTKVKHKKNKKDINPKGFWSTWKSSLMCSIILCFLVAACIVAVIFLNQYVNADPSEISSVESIVESISDSIESVL